MQLFKNHKFSIIISIFILFSLLFSTQKIVASEQSFSISGGNPKTIDMLLNEGDTIKGQIDVTSGGTIDLFIMDSDNYNAYKNGGATYSEFLKRGFTSTKFTFIASSSGTWYFTFATPNSLDSSRSITFTYDSGGNSGLFSSFAIDPFFLGVVGITWFILIWVIGYYKFGITISYFTPDPGESYKEIQRGTIHWQKRLNAPFVEYKTIYKVVVITISIAYFLFFILSVSFD